MHTNTKTTSLIFLGLCMLWPAGAIADPLLTPEIATEPYTQEFILTAYYSPLPNQCCYVKGDFESDKILNGNGTNGADGTEVYPGMIAAPKSYPFGTRIALPGLGTLTVHDRGGAIVEQSKGHRIDVWVGSGEEGLARALAFGVKRIRGTVYPTQFAQPEESLDLAALPAPLSVLKHYLGGETTLFDLSVHAGDRGLSVAMLQETLRQTGYFEDEATGFFGDRTGQSLAQVYNDFGIADDPKSLTENGAAVLEALSERIGAKDPVPLAVDSLTSPAQLAQTQRTLRFLGYYHGRTNGQYDAGVVDAIFRFQRDHELVGDMTSAGAGRIGPKTRALLIRDWNKRIVTARAQELLLEHDVKQLVAQKGYGLNTLLSRGQKGDDVRTLQNFRASRGFFPRGSVNGVFGELTEKSVIDYQVARGLIRDASDKAAGFVGPATVLRITRERTRDLIKLVRAEGIKAL